MVCLEDLNFWVNNKEINQKEGQNMAFIHEEIFYEDPIYPHTKQYRDNGHTLWVD